MCLFFRTTIKAILLIINRIYLIFSNFKSLHPRHTVTRKLLRGASVRLTQNRTTHSISWNFFLIHTNKLILISYYIILF